LRTKKNNFEKGNSRKNIAKLDIYNRYSNAEARKTDETGQTFKLKDNAYLA
jgi:hypothetical protein